MSRSISHALDQLPQSSATVSILSTLDNVIPGEWNNITDFDAMIAHITDVDAPGVIADVRRRADILAQDPERHYSTALSIFELVDTLDQVAAGAAVASKVSDLFGGLDFLKKFTPKPETTQAIDAGLKLVAELLAFGALRGVPEATFDGITDFAIALQQYGKSDITRHGSWIIVDGLLPLGPNFMQIIISTISKLASNHLSGNAIFESFANKLPGSSTEEKQSFILKALEAVSEWVSSFIEQHGLTQEMAKEKLFSALNFAEGGMDYVAAALDASTSYFSHTGTQTVSRVLIQDAYAELREEVWQDYVSSQS